MALTKILRRWWEWAFGAWYEGPTTPARLVQQPRIWANTRPKATRAEWLALCEAAVRSAYAAGWQRGFEHAEREPGGPSQVPEQLADLLHPGWREAAPLAELDFLDPSSVPLEYEHGVQPPGLSLVELQRIRRRDGLPLR